MVSSHSLHLRLALSDCVAKSQPSLNLPRFAIKFLIGQCPLRQAREVVFPPFDKGGY